MKTFVSGNSGFLCWEAFGKAQERMDEKPCSVHLGFSVTQERSSEGWDGGSKNGGFERKWLARSI